MDVGEYIVGAVLLTAIWGAVLAAGWLLVRGRLGGLRGAARAVAVGLLATLGLIVTHVLPLALGVLGRETVLGAALLWLVGAALLARRRAPGDEDRTSASGTREEWPARVAASGRLSRALALIGLGALSAAVAGYLYRAAPVAATHIDTLTFHLPNVARWIQTGSVWQIDQFVPDQAQGYYPHNGDIAHLAAVLPWRNDAFVRVLNVPFLALAGLAVYALARELRAARTTAVLAGSLLVAMPAAASPALEKVNVDPVMLAAFAAGVLFLLRHTRSVRRGELVLAGVGLGLALGTKWYGVSAAVCVLATWAVATLLSRAGPRIVARRGLALCGLIGLTGGFWLLRNWVESGNPLFPVEVAAGGVTIFDAPPDIPRALGGFSIAHYLDDPGVLATYVLPALHAQTGVAGVLLMAASLLLGAAAIALGVSRRGRALIARDPRSAAGWACAALLLVAYLVTPYSAFGPEGAPINTAVNVRYALPALVLAVPLAASAAARLGRLRPIAEALLLLAVVECLVLSFGGAAGRVDASGLLVGALVTVGAALTVLAARRPAPRLRGALSAAAVCLALVGAAGYVLQERFNSARYDYEPVFAWVADHAPAGHRVGVAGVGRRGFSAVLPMFGPRYRNEVEFVGYFDRGFLRAYDGRAGFLGMVERRGYDLLAVMRGPSSLTPAAELERWVRSAGYEPVAESEDVALYAVRSGA